ncbi:4-(cytidine 5'-diphospho)-2-C-methyl-D-erythritol kinase [bacterium]|nr:4-(cytidine 5'-diphospho)-2-C-methyl-D-erythritol kinase [bacterium]
MDLMAKMNGLTIKANAKINLCLRVVGRRTDGYHQIETIFQEIDFGDILTMQPSTGDIKFEVRGLSVPTDETNLVMRAVAAMRAQFRTSQGVRIVLEKKIPIGAGLGGGSSDAAATLKGLSAVWNIRATAEQLHAIAARLGADVPFFLQGGSCLGTGRGDILTPIPDLKPFPLLILKPDCAINTTWVYQHFRTENEQSDLTKLAPFINISTLVQKIDWLESVKSLLVNDLEQVVLPRFAEVARLRTMLLERGASVSLMSGSGSTVFGLFQDERARDVAYDGISDQECLRLKAAFARRQDLQVGHEA